MMDEAGIDGVSSDKGAHRRDDFIRRTEVWAVARRIQNNELASRNATLDVIADFR